MLYYTHSGADVLQDLHATEKGLTSSEAAARLKTYGKNVLEEKDKISPIKILRDQFNSQVVWILLADLVISFFIGEKVDAIVILAIIFFELYQSFASRSTIFPSLKVGIYKNPALVGAILFSFIIAAAAVYLPYMNTLFGTASLRSVELLIVLLLSSFGFIYLEISKHVRSKKMAFEAI